MADTVKNTEELKFEFAFADGDTRTYRIRNPKSKGSVLYNKIDEINTYILENGLLVGDKADGAFTGIYRVKIVNATKTNLDLA